MIFLNTIKSKLHLFSKSKKNENEKYFQKLKTENKNKKKHFLKPGAPKLSLKLGYGSMFSNK